MKLFGITQIFDGNGAAVNVFEEYHPFAEFLSLVFSDHVLYLHACEFEVVLFVLPHVHFSKCDDVQRLPVPESELVTDNVWCLSVHVRHWRVHESRLITAVLPRVRASEYALVVEDVRRLHAHETRSARNPTNSSSAARLATCAYWLYACTFGTTSWPDTRRCTQTKQSNSLFLQAL